MFVLLATDWGLKRSNESNLKELLFDRAQKVKAGLDFSFRVVCLHRGGYHCDKPTLGGNLREYECRIVVSRTRLVRASHLIGCGDHGHVNVRLSSNLLLWDDDLS